MLGWAVAVDAMRRIALRMDGRPAAVVVAIMAVTGLLLMVGGWVFSGIYLLAELVGRRMRPGGSWRPGVRWRSTSRRVPPGLVFEKEAVKDRF